MTPTLTILDGQTAAQDRFLRVLNNRTGEGKLRRRPLELLQVNLGDYCNQCCTHCHVDAGPHGEKNMNAEVADAVVAFLRQTPGLELDITGGAPELNPQFRRLVQQARPLVRELLVRTNLTVLFEPGQEDLVDFYGKHRVRLIASMPCYLEENVDRQRGKGVFEKSIAALRKLNENGYGDSRGLPLDLVFNPQGASLPPSQAELEPQYKQVLAERYGVEFHRLFTIANVPINRFRQSLEAKGRLEKYIDTLESGFNPSAAGNVMCRTFLSVGYDGYLYDCDFNQMLGWAMRDASGQPMTIHNVDAEALDEREILVGDHCFACTAGAGSSCKGELVATAPSPTRTKPAIAAGVTDVVKEYYGKHLQGTGDLKTSACCSFEKLSPERKEILSKIDSEIKDRFYGCGSPIPPALRGCTVLDLGCGTGRDVYTASYLVGEGGLVIGVDMTEEQLGVARKHIGTQTRAFGFAKPNVTFKHGYIEDLKSLGIDDGSVDVVISNCVINLSPDKRAVFSEIFRVLKPGGELYFSDVFSGRRVPEKLREDPVLYGECLSGAMYIEDFRRLLRELGCLDYRVTAARPIKLNNPELEVKAGGIDFHSMTIRAFKLQLEDICEDYGQVAYYKGDIPGHPHEFDLDDHHGFFTGKPMLVCGNTAAMLQETRYGDHFHVAGDRSMHFGVFECGPGSAKGGERGEGAGGACC